MAVARYASTLLGCLLLASFARSQRECECVMPYLCEGRSVNVDGAGLLDIRQSKCGSGEVCCDLPAGSPSRQGEARQELPTVAGTGNCGRRRLPPGDFTLKVTGANDGLPPDQTFYGEAPWMVAILHQQEGQKVFACGGTLITTSIVLTAAHCVNVSVEDTSVRAGVHDKNNQNPPLPAQTRNVTRISVHPQYNSENLQNDIALIFLEGAFELSGIVDVICLPQTNQQVNPNGCFVSGWGRNASQPRGSYQGVLSKVNLQLRERQDCLDILRTSRLGKHFRLHEGFICAGGGNNLDTCLGDGGGPLVCPSREDANTLIQMGVVSWGIGCGEGFPTVLSSVSHYADWLSSQISQT